MLRTFVDGVLQGDQKGVVTDLIGSREFVVFSLPNCPQCDLLMEKIQEQFDIQAADYFVKLDKTSSDYQLNRAELVKAIGMEKFQFPVAFAWQTYLGDYKSAMRMVENDSELRTALSEKLNWAPRLVIDDDF